MSDPIDELATTDGTSEEQGTASSRRDKLEHWGKIVEALCAILLVIITGFYTHYASRQSGAAIKAANAAESAAKTASATLNEMQHGSGATDTHTLAQQAVAQATQTTNLADAAVKQANELSRSVLQERRLAEEAQIANNTNREALTSVQRAFLTFATGKLDMGMVGDNAFIDGKWDNIGNTPAIRVWTRYRYDQVKKLPDDYKFTFAPPNSIVPFVLGGHSEVGISSLPIPKKNISIYGPQGVFYGWAVYQDMFKNTPLHLTEFCFQIAMTMRPHGNAPIAISPEWDTCARHSCFDEDCPDYEQVTKQALNYQSATSVSVE